MKNKNVHGEYFYIIYCRCYSSVRAIGIFAMVVVFLEVWEMRDVVSEKM